MASQMKVYAALLLLLVPAASHVATDRSEKNRPVSKVITLLKDMVTQLDKEAEEDEEVYETFGCWCETNDKEKTKAIAEGTSTISSLGSEIEELAGESSRLNTEVANLNKEIEKNTAALDTATALRQKQNAEFNTEEKDMLQSIASLKSAVTVLDKKGAASSASSALLQRHSNAATAETELITIVADLKDVLHKHRDLFRETISPHQRHLVDAFLQAPEQYFDTEPTSFSQSSAPSGEVFGIIKQMKETFETNLAQAQKDEIENAKAYEDVKAAKTDEIAAGQAAADSKTVELATADEKQAQASQAKEDAEETLAADTKFLANLKEQCALMDSEYEERTKTRQAEIQAVSKALEFLSSDEAHDLFSRSFNPAMLQKRAESRHRADLSKMLMAAARKFHSPQLSAIAVQARLDAFTKVKESIQQMVDNLMKEKEDDMKHKDFCVDEFNKNQVDTESKDREKADTMAKIDDLQMTIDTLTKAMEMLKAEVAEMQIQLKRAGSDREKENKDFQLTIADARATQKLLTAALGVLKGFYGGAALVQGSKGKGQSQQVTSAHQAPPPGFKTYKKSAAGGGVMGMIQQIIDDSKAMESEALRAETDAQKSYEEFVTDTNASIDEKTKDLVNKTEQKGKTETAKVETEVHRDAVLGDLETLDQESSDLHKSCDFLLKNFELRTTAREEEIEALKQGIAMFSGASFSALISRA